MPSAIEVTLSKSIEVLGYWSAKVRSSQEEENNKYTLPFHAEGKNLKIRKFLKVLEVSTTIMIPKNLILEIWG